MRNPAPSHVFILLFKAPTNNPFHLPSFPLLFLSSRISCSLISILPLNFLFIHPISETLLSHLSIIHIHFSFLFVYFHLSTFNSVALSVSLSLCLSNSFSSLSIYLHLYLIFFLPPLFSSLILLISSLHLLSPSLSLYSIPHILLNSSFHLISSHFFHFNYFFDSIRSLS